MCQRVLVFGVLLDGCLECLLEQADEGCGFNSAIGSEIVGSEIVVSIGDDVDLLARFDVDNIALAPLAFFAEV